jgi:hypothetical protein
VPGFAGELVDVDADLGDRAVPLGLDVAVEQQRIVGIDIEPDIRRMSVVGVSATSSSISTDPSSSLSVECSTKPLEVSTGPP